MIKNNYIGLGGNNGLQPSANSDDYGMAILNSDGEIEYVERPKTNAFLERVVAPENATGVSITEIRNTDAVNFDLTGKTKPATITNNQDPYINGKINAMAAR